MENNNDKSKTVQFNPIREEKKQVNREESDIYSSARKNDFYKNEKEDNKNRNLVYIAIVLSVLLVIAVIAGAIILSSGEKSDEKLPDEIGNEIVKTQENEEKEEEKKQEQEKEVIISSDVVFYGDSIIKKGDFYTVLADLYDNSFKKTDNRKLVINSETDIRENGKRMTPEGLIYTIESMAGEQIIFECKIRESDNVLLSVSYEGNFREEVKEEEPEKEEETPKEDVILEESTENKQPHDNIETSEGLVDGI